MYIDRLTIVKLLLPIFKATFESLLTRNAKELSSFPVVVLYMCPILLAP